MSTRELLRALPRPEINVTPLIDVMLVLLIIFMVVVPVIAVPVNLPIAFQASPSPEEPGDIVLTVHRSGSYSLETISAYAGTSQLTPRDVTSEQLRHELAQMYAHRARNRILYLKADSSLPFAPIERALEVARQAGVRVVAAVTDWRQAGTY